MTTATVEWRSEHRGQNLWIIFRRTGGGSWVPQVVVIYPRGHGNRALIYLDKESLTNDRENMRAVVRKHQVDGYSVDWAPASRERLGQILGARVPPRRIARKDERERDLFHKEMRDGSDEEDD